MFNKCKYHIPDKQQALQSFEHRMDYALCSFQGPSQHTCVTCKEAGLSVCMADDCGNCLAQRSIMKDLPGLV